MPYILLSEQLSGTLFPAQHPFMIKGIAVSIFAGIAVFNILKRIVLKKKIKLMEEFIMKVENSPSEPITGDSSHLEIELTETDNDTEDLTEDDY